MQQIVFLGVAAGLASALLYGGLTPGWVLLAPLLFVAPAPLLIVGIGWHPLVAALGALFGCIAISAFIGSKLALSYGLMIGLPAWLLSLGVTRLMRSMPPGTAPAVAGRVFATYVLGGIASFSALAIVGGAIALSPDYAVFEARLAAVFQKMLVDFSRMQDPNMDSVALGRMAQTFVRIFVPMSAIIVALSLTFSLWLAVRALIRNERLPFAALPAYSLSFGKDVLFWLAGALLVAQAGGFLGLLGAALTGTVVFILMLNGLALVHYRTLGHEGRSFMLWATWAALVLIAPAALLFSIAGLVDALFDLRQNGGPKNLNP